MRVIGMCVLVALGLSAVVGAQRPAAPRIWDDEKLANWATPVAGLNLRPSHYSSAEYYASPAENLRTYAVYHPDHEPPGYWEWLQQQKPEPLVDVSTIRNQGDWIAAGDRAFRELDSPYQRTKDPALIALFRDRERLHTAEALPDGRLPGPQRWVVTPEGVMITVTACASCHLGANLDGQPGPGGRRGAPQRAASGPGFRSPFAGAIGTAWRLQRFYAGDPLPLAFWREFTVPWAPDERIERFRAMSIGQLQQLGGMAQLGRSFSGGVFARTNGSPYAPTKVMDLQNVRDSRYLDATATHRLRGPEDLARYAALVSGADKMEFGAHQILTDAQRRVRFHFADEVLYAIGVYLLSLEPPANPTPAPAAMLEQGRRIFRREGCANCHVPPAYTSGKLTLAAGWQPPADHPNRIDILPISVGTDPDTALKTRKGTGVYKIPSLRGVWYRPRLLHDGSLATLEEMFDPARLDPDFEPKGWSPPGVSRRAVPGHRFGLTLPDDEKASLLAFLRGL